MAILQFEPIRRISSSALTGTYAVVSTPITNPARCILLANNTNQTVTISFDGTNDNIDMAATATLVLDVAALKSITEDEWLRAGLQVWAKGTAGTGSFCVTSIY